MCFRKIIFFYFCTKFTYISSCPNGTFSNTVGDKCYFVINEAKQFILAEHDCLEKNGDLASVQNAFDNIYLTANAQNLLSSNVSFVWLGGNNINNGTWIWTDGQTFSYKNWAKGNPDNQTGDSCLTLNLSNGLWLSHSCYELNPSICELVPTTTANSTSPLTTRPTLSPPSCEIVCPDGWMYFSKTGYCYKAFYSFNNPVSFMDSESICANYSGHLASIHSSDEDKFIATSNAWSAYIGLYFSNDSNTFKWTDTSPVDFTNFETNDTSHSSYCVTQQSDGYFYTYECETDIGNPMHRFICKTNASAQQNTNFEIIHSSLSQRNTKYGASSCPTKCPDGCYGQKPVVGPFIDHHLYYYQVYYDAVKLCGQENSTILSVHSDSENNFLSQILGDDYFYWMGLSYNFTISNYTWADNTPYDYSKWAPDEPDIFENNNYCVLNKGFHDSFSWYSNDCSDLYRFICKKAPNF